MHILKLTQEQLLVTKKALDFYLRIGIGQFNEIVSHPTFEEFLFKTFSDQSPLKVGDNTMRGEVVEIAKNGKWIKTKGSWGNGEEVKKWTDVDKIKKSPDWTKLRETQEKAEDLLSIGRNVLMNTTLGKNGSWGIHNENVDESCRVAYDIQKAISHEYWKQYKDENYWSVDSSRSNITPEGHKIQCQLDENELVK